MPLLQGCELPDRFTNLLMLTKPSYYDLGTDIYEYGWGQSMHFCRFAYGERLHQAIARHEHYLAAKIGIKGDDKVLDVGCGIGGPAREIAKFTGAHITGLNNNDYQIDRATLYAQKEGLAHQLEFVKGDFMVRINHWCSATSVLHLTRISKCRFPTIHSTVSMLSKLLYTLPHSKASILKFTASLNRAESSGSTNGS